MVWPNFFLMIKLFLKTRNTEENLCDLESGQKKKCSEAMMRMEMSSIHGSWGHTATLQYRGVSPAPPLQNELGKRPQSQGQVTLSISREATPILGSPKPSFPVIATQPTHSR